MNKLEQKLVDLTKYLRFAREQQDYARVAELEDEIEELEYEIDQEANRNYGDDRY